MNSDNGRGGATQEIVRLARLLRQGEAEARASESETLRAEGQRVADAAASAAATQAITDHVGAPNPHPQYLTQDEGDALYEPLGGGGGTDPTTTQGDLIYRGPVALERLGIGAAGTFLRSVGGVPAWVALTWAMIGSTPTTLAGYGITDAQPLDADLTAIAALSTTSFGRSLLTQADAAAARAYIGAGTGTVSSIGLSVSGAIHSVSGSPVTGSGTIALNLLTQTANRVFAGPSSGAAAVPAFRALIAADMPSNVAAHYTTAAGQSIDNNTVTVVNFGTSVIDTHSAVTTGSGWVFTAPIAGNYLVAAKLLFSGSTGWADTEFMLLSLYRAGALYAHLSRSDNYSSASSVLLGINGTALVPLTAGQTIDIRVQQTSGAALALLTTAAHNHVSIVRV